MQYHDRQIGKIIAVNPIALEDFIRHGYLAHITLMQHDGSIINGQLPMNHKGIYRNGEERILPRIGDVVDIVWSYEHCRLIIMSRTPLETPSVYDGVILGKPLSQDDIVREMVKGAEEGHEQEVEDLVRDIFRQVGMSKSRSMSNND